MVFWALLCISLLTTVHSHVLQVKDAGLDNASPYSALPARPLPRVDALDPASVCYTYTTTYLELVHPTSTIARE